MDTHTTDTWGVGTNDGTTLFTFKNYGAARDALSTMNLNCKRRGRCNVYLQDLEHTPDIGADQAAVWEHSS